MRYKPHSVLMKKKLTPKQERFCQEYIIDLNGTQAAIRAGYSKKTAYSISEENLRKPEIKTRIEELQAELRERNKLKADDVIQELRALAFWNIKDFITTNNQVNDLSTMEREALKPVAGIKVKKEIRTIGEMELTEITTELKLTDKRAALVDLGRHLGIFKEDNEQKVVKIKVTRK